MNEFRRLHGRQVLIQTTDDTTIAGLITLTGKRSLTIEGASALSGDEDRPIDGEVVVMLDQITWLQAL